MLVSLGSERRFQRTYASRLVWGMLEAERETGSRPSACRPRQSHGPCLVLRGPGRRSQPTMVPLKRRPVVSRFEQDAPDRRWHSPLCLHDCSRRSGLALSPDRTHKAVLQVFSGSLWSRYCSCGQLGILMAVDGLHFFWRHSRVWVRKLQAVIGEAARHHFCVDHGVAFLPSSTLAACAGSAPSC